MLVQPSCCRVAGHAGDMAPPSAAAALHLHVRFAAAAQNATIPDPDLRCFGPCAALLAEQRLNAKHGMAAFRALFTEVVNYQLVQRLPHYWSRHPTPDGCFEGAVRCCAVRRWCAVRV